MVLVVKLTWLNKYLPLLSILFLWKCGIHPRNICETAQIDVAVARRTIVLKAEASLSQAEWEARAHSFV